MQSNETTGRIICRRVLRRCCWYCGNETTFLCDYERAGRTCDRPCCEAHSVRVGTNVDFCAEHAQATGRGPGPRP